MRVLFMLTFLTLLTLPAISRENKPIIKRSGQLPNDFVPKSWIVIDSASGDLNKDSIPDYAMIVQNTDARNFITNDGMGSDTLNVNPRILIVLLREKSKGYILAVQNNTNFIPPPNDSQSSCLADPLEQTEGLNINKGLLELHFQYWMSCGSWFTSNNDYLFRYQNKRFELIGYNSMSFHRSSGEIEEHSINFSTKKMSHTTGGNMFEETQNKPKVTWKKLTQNKLMNLEEMNDESLQEIMEITD